tara:strand:- start:1166 stop:2050 length:885 start_codon:yes stop_codon:yes gene_type:complete
MLLNRKAAQEFHPRTSYSIDPLAAYQRLSDDYVGQPSGLTHLRDKLREAEIQAFYLSQAVNEQRIARGQYPLQIGVQLAPDVFYKRQHRKDQNVPQGTPWAPGTEVEFMQLRNTPMMDWDTPDPIHPDSSVTVQNLGDVEEIVRDYISKNPESMMRLYQTPGGYRAWELGIEANANQHAPALTQMLVDPNYVNYNQFTDQILDNRAVQNAGFNSRISHKPGRIDWVAQPIAEIRGSEAMPSSRSTELVKLMHDDPIKRAYLDKGGTAQAVALLNQHLPTASQTLQREISRRLSL